MNPVTKQLLVTPSPHLKSADTTQRIMFQVLVGLMPALVASVVLFGYRSLILVAVSIASCVLSEYLFNLITRRKQTIGDLSAVVTGTLLAFNVPSTLPWWMVAVGGFAAIFIAKQLFGGIGQNFANPAIVGRVVMILFLLRPHEQLGAAGDGRRGGRCYHGNPPWRSSRAARRRASPRWGRCCWACGAAAWARPVPSP